MQTNTPTIRTYAYKYGVIISIITISFSLMLHFMDLTYSGSNVPQIVNLVVSAACIIVAIVSFRSANSNKLNVRQAVKLGTATAVISGIIAVFYTLLFTNVIEPDFVERLGNEVTESKLQKAPDDLDKIQNSRYVEIFWVIHFF